MKRTDVVQQIKFHNEELTFLSNLKTSCMTCCQYDVDSCKLHGVVPVEFRTAETCPDWEFDQVPF